MYVALFLDSDPGEAAIKKLQDATVVMAYRKPAGPNGCCGRRKRSKSSPWRAHAWIGVCCVFVEESALFQRRIGANPAEIATS
jgi:hypothetical protein